ncbi:MAG: hypothetical protein ACI396_10890 [Acutalibacteraceae bacterium]
MDYQITNNTRDICRIRTFCEKFATLWERHPDLRFGQIISALQSFTDSGKTDIFYVEDDEMLKIISRYFGGGESN